MRSGCIQLLLFSFLYGMVLIFPGKIHAFESDFRGQLSVWTIEARNEHKWKNNTGIRYIPLLSLNRSIDEESFIDTELSINSFLSTFENKEGKHGDVELYRMWLRYASTQFEIRAGLQKINFGSAILLRPLMWFDRMDSRDPLQLTKGVNALLGRYYFLNNANIWIWGLLGNDETKGWESFPSHKNKMEFGGRAQIPFYNGELAFTYHHRGVNLRNHLLAVPLSSEDVVPENRFALDGKWDVGIGLWFESVFIHQALDRSTIHYKRLLNIGMDYTFDLGDGLNIIGEYFTIGTTEDFFDSGEEVSFTAVSVKYPLNILDNISAIVYYNRDHRDWYRFINWQRKYDNWSFFVMGFWNPGNMQLNQNRIENGLVTGKGFQLMIVFNH